MKFYKIWILEIFFLTLLIYLFQCTGATDVGDSSYLTWLSG